MLPKIREKLLNFYWQIKSFAKYHYWSNKKLSFKNSEGQTEYNFTLPASNLCVGVSAMLRAKNEESKIYDCLESIFEVFTEIIFVDNGSTDGTAEIVRKFKKKNDVTNKLKIYEYPHEIARWGKSHLLTPENSLHSNVYYTNWCLSKCTSSYICKWDADMLLHNKGKSNFGDFLASLSRRKATVISLPEQKVYRDLKGDHYLGKGEFQEEDRIFPNCSAVNFRKARDWEVLGWSIDVVRDRFPILCIFEIKDTRENEYVNWTNINFVTGHKAQEYRSFQIIKEGKSTKDDFEWLGQDLMKSTSIYSLNN
jgi:glycosyltransferase involved in cell wall biosynthesis